MRKSLKAYLILSLNLFLFWFFASQIGLQGGNIIAIIIFLSVINAILFMAPYVSLAPPNASFHHPNNLYENEKFWKTRRSTNHRPPKR